MRSFVTFCFFCLVFLFLFGWTLWVLRWSAIYWRRRTLTWWRWWRIGGRTWRWRTLYCKKLPSSTSSVVTLWSRSWWWATFLLTRRLYSKSKALHFFIMHFFDCVFCVIVILKFLTLKRFLYNETIGPFVLDAVDLSIRFKPFLQVLFCYWFTITFHVNFGIAAPRHFIDINTN